MKNFDIENSINPFLIKGALIKFENEICKVVNMTKTEILIENEKLEIKSINDGDWEGIKLNENLLNKLGLEIGSEILNKKTNTIWTIRKTENYFYITIKNDFNSGENPVVGIKTVNELQEWFYRLTESTLQQQII